jgi:hypothetical protein
MRVPRPPHDRTRTTMIFSWQDRTIRAEIIGSNECRAEGYIMRGAFPVLKLCSNLIEAGFDTAIQLSAYRGDVLCLAVRTIGAGAALTVDEHNGTRFAKWKPLPRSAVSPPMRQNGQAATTPARGAPREAQS